MRTHLENHAGEEERSVAPLGQDLRRAPDKAVREAQRVADNAARKTFEKRPVHRFEPQEFVTRQDRAPRNRLHTLANTGNDG